LTAVQRRLHRLGRNEERLHQERLDEECDENRERDQKRQLAEEPLAFDVRRCAGRLVRPLALERTVFESAHGSSLVTSGMSSQSSTVSATIVPSTPTPLNDRRCTGDGPCSRRARQGSAVPYPLFLTNPNAGKRRCKRRIARSRTTFATIDAAATVAETRSPFL